MMRISKIALAAAAVALGAGIATTARAQQDAEVEAALNAGAVGEQADGYMGFAKSPSTSLKAKVDAINIKRREAYTKVAQTKNVPIEAFAASVGCTTLGSLKPGRAYSVARGVWATRGGAPVALPGQCGN